MIGLVDADILIYRCGFAAEKKRKITHEETGEIEHVRDVAPLSHALQNLDTVMASLYKKFDSLEVYLSGKGNFRKELATIKPYKGNRSPFARPVYYKELRKHLGDKYRAIIIDEMEADDILGLRQTDGSNNTCIVSIDKDLLMIPGNHYNWVKDEYRTVTEVEGLRSFYRQSLVGDSTDNIPGVEGIGPVGARKIIDQYSSERGMYQAAKAEWHRRYPDGIEREPEGLGGISSDSAFHEVLSLLWIARTGRPRWKLEDIGGGG